MAPPGRALDLGAGAGAVSLWLLQQGYSVDAVESDPSKYAELDRTLTKTAARAVFVDIRRYPLPRRRYSLVTALAFLHFFHPDEIRLLALRIMRTLAPGGFLLASAFTTDDPGFHALRETGQNEIAPATFRLPDRRGLIHYFAPGEFARLFRGLQILEAEEERRLDPEHPAGMRAGVNLVARKAPSSRA